MTENFTFLVSQPSCSKNIASGYRVFQCKDDRLTVLNVNTTNKEADTNSIVQKFCYLRPKRKPIQPTSKYLNYEESSDFLLIARNNGIIEIIKDYDFKVTNSLSLKPDYLLFCLPMTVSVSTNDTTIVGLEYRDRFLYVCSACGDIYGFILNLPEDYVQYQDFIGTAEYNSYRDSFSWRSENTTEPDTAPSERRLRDITRFKKEHSCGHICYYCYPINDEGYYHETIKKWYPEPVPTFSNCFVTFLRTDVSSFHINPMDRFSVITVDPQAPLTIHKILLPEFFPSFFQEFVKLKDTYFSRKHRRVAEPPSFDFMSRVIHGVAFQDYLKKEGSGFGEDDDVRSWRSSLVCDMVCELKFSSVWRQKQGKTNDSLHNLFFYDNNSEIKSSDGQRQSNVLTPAVNLSLDPDSYWLLGIPSDALDSDSQPMSTQTLTEKFLKYLRKQTFPVNFQVVKTISLDADTTEFEAATSFLTDTYKDMDIVVVDKFLGVNAFRPKYVDEPLMRLDKIHDLKEVDPKEYAAKEALNNFSSFMKFFMLSDSLCMIWDINGVLLIDRFQLRDTKNLLHNEIGAIKVIQFNVGVVNDIAVVLNRFKQQDSDCRVEFRAILTKLSGEIVLLKGEFLMGERLGKMEALDFLKSHDNNKFVDQILITKFEESKKREVGFESDILQVTKRLKVDDISNTE